MYETYKLCRVSGGWNVFRVVNDLNVKIGHIDGKALSLTIPCMDYCERHNVELSQLRHRELKVRGHTIWRTFEITHN